jgi:hypothetical protein
MQRHVRAWVDYGRLLEEGERDGDID